MAHKLEPHWHLLPRLGGDANLDVAFERPQAEYAELRRNGGLAAPIMGLANLYMWLGDLTSPFIVDSPMASDPRFGSLPSDRIHIVWASRFIQILGWLHAFASHRPHVLDAEDRVLLIWPNAPYLRSNKYDASTHDDSVCSHMLRWVILVAKSSAQQLKLTPAGSVRGKISRPSPQEIAALAEASPELIVEVLQEITHAYIETFGGDSKGKPKANDGRVVGDIYFYRDVLIRYSRILWALEQQRAAEANETPATRRIVSLEMFKEEEILAVEAAMREHPKADQALVDAVRKIRKQQGHRAGLKTQKILDIRRALLAEDSGNFPPFRA